MIPQLALSGFVPGAPGAHKIDVTCLAFVLCSRGRTIVVDTGPDAKLAQAAGFTAEGDAVAALDRALRARGRERADVTMVVHTHLHYDHMQNDDAFGAAEIVVADLELANALEKGTENYYVGIDAFVASNRDRLRVLRPGATLAPGVRTVPTGGHTPGHQAVVVGTAIGPVCLAGDEVPMSINVIAPPANSYDARATAAFLALARRRQWLVVPSHDPYLGYLGTIAGTGGDNA
jgi:glyoxylase-like metal-dependent hydrolase (beta-lactamase superfamily II)